MAWRGLVAVVVGSQFGSQESLQCRCSNAGHLLRSQHREVSPWPAPRSDTAGQDHNEWDTVFPEPRLAEFIVTCCCARPGCGASSVVDRRPGRSGGGVCQGWARSRSSRMVCSLAWIRPTAGWRSRCTAQGRARRVPTARSSGRARPGSRRRAHGHPGQHPRRLLEPGHSTKPIMPQPGRIRPPAGYPARR